MDVSVKKYILNILNRYNDNEQFSYSTEKAIGDLCPLIIFNKNKKIYTAFSDENKTDKFSRDIKDVLDNDILSYISYLANNKNINKHKLGLDHIIRIVLSNFYMFSLTSSFNGIILDTNDYYSVQKYIEEIYRVKLRHHMILNILNNEMFNALFMRINNRRKERISRFGIDFTPSSAVEGLVYELLKLNNVSDEYKNHFYYILRNFMRGKIKLPLSVSSELNQGIIRLYLQINLTQK